MTLLLRLSSAGFQFLIVGILPILINLPSERIEVLNKVVLVAALAKIGIDSVVLASGRQNADARGWGLPIVLLSGYLLLTSVVLGQFAGLEFDALASAYLFSLMSTTFFLHLMVLPRWRVIAFTPALAITVFFATWLLPAIGLLAALSTHVRIDIDLRRVFSAKSLLLMLLGTFAPIYSYLSYRYMAEYFPPELANVMGRLVSLTFLLKGVLNINDWRSGPGGRNFLHGRKGLAMVVGSVLAVAVAGAVNPPLAAITGFAVFFLIGPPYWRVLVERASAASAIVFGLTVLTITEMVFEWIPLVWFFLLCALAATVLALLSLGLSCKPPVGSNDDHRI